MGLEPTASQVVNQTLYPLSYEGERTAEGAESSRNALTSTDLQSGTFDLSVISP